MPKRSRQEAITTDITNDVDENILKPSSKKRKLTSLNDQEPQEDGTELQMDGWNFDKTTFESNENNNNNDKTTKNNVDDKETNKMLNTSGFSAFTGMGFERSISNNTSPEKNGKNKKNTPPKNQYVSDDDDNNENKNQNEETDFEKSWKEFEDESIRNTDENDGEISWKWDDNTTGTSEFNWSWNDNDKDKKNDNDNVIDPSLENTDTNSSWNFDFNSNSKSNVEWGTQVDEDTIEPIAELNGENKEKGDENDKTLYSIKVKVYAFKKGEIKPNDNENNEENNKLKWRECGEGILKINQYIENENNKEKNKEKISGRILCRRDNIHTVILNEPIVKEPDDWYKLLKDTRVQFGVIKTKNKENDNNKENNNNISDNATNLKSNQQIVPHFVKPLNGGTEAAKALLNWIRVAQNCVKNQTPYKERSNDNTSNVNTDNIDDDDI